MKRARSPAPVLSVSCSHWRGVPGRGRGVAFFWGGAAEAGVRGEVLVPLREGGGSAGRAWREGGDPAGGAGAGWLWLLLPPHVAGGRRAVQFAHSQLPASPSGSPRVSGAMAFAETNPAASSLPNGDCGRPRARPGGNRVTVVLGAQWGDEGKGKVVDLLAQDADIVCRCQVRRQGSDGKPVPELGPRTCIHRPK